MEIIKEVKSMVTFFLDSKDSMQATYKYYPENDTAKACGYIKADLIKGEISIITAAEGDFLRRASADELNHMRDSINEMRIENGKPPLTEKELPTANKDEKWYCYVDYAIKKLTEELSKGNIPEKGVAAWY